MYIDKLFDLKHPFSFLGPSFSSMDHCSRRPPAGHQRTSCFACHCRLATTRRWNCPVQSCT